MKHWFAFLVFCLSAVSSYSQNTGWLTLNEISPNAAYDYPAHVYVDGTYVADLPATIALSHGKHRIAVKKELHKDYEIIVDVQRDRHSALPLDMVENGRAVTVRSDGNPLIYVDGTLVARGETTIDLAYGAHAFRAERSGCVPSEMLVMVTSDTEQVVIPAPETITGVLAVNSNVEGAEVDIDGKLAGKTPLNIKNLPVGDHYVYLSAEGYAACSRMVTVEQDVDTELTMEMEKLEPVSIRTNVSSGVVTIDKERVSEYPVYLRKGTYPVSITAQGYKPLKKTMVVKEGNNDFKYKLKRDRGPMFSEDGGLYANVGYQVLRFPAMELNLGVDAGINIELNMLSGFKSSEYVKTPDSQSYSYKPKFYVGLNLGYGILIGNRFKITPQVGLGTMWCSSTLQSSPGSATKSYAAAGDEGDSEQQSYERLAACSFVFAGKFELALTSWCALFVKPSYTAPILTKSSQVREVMNLSDQVNKYFKGFDVSVGLNFHFDI